MTVQPPRRLTCAVHAALLLLGVPTFLLTAAPRDASADCALIPAAIKQLASDDGTVDRPFAAPMDEVTLFSDGACKAGPEFAHFSKIKAENEVTISFEPPHYPAAPAVCGNNVQEAGEFCDDGNTEPYDGCSAKCAPEVTVAPSRDPEDCGDNRCFALRFEMPETASLGAPYPSYPLTGPARIRARNVAAGETVVEIGKLYDPKRGCNKNNGARNVFRHFTALPPRNNFANASSLGILATVDGSGSLLVPLDYGTVLAGAFGVGGEGALRILNATASLPNGLTGGNGLGGTDDSLIRIPRRGRFLRSYSFNGRPIPPLLEVSGSFLTDAENVAYGDLILGSVDFIDSVIRISRRAKSPRWDDPPKSPGVVPVQVFALGSAPGAEPSGMTLIDGIGPISISPGALTLGAGAAAPLNSLTPSRDVVVVARDEKLEAPFDGGAPVPGNQNLDTDSDDRVVHFINLTDGSEFTTGQAVTESGPPPKAAVDSQGPIVGFLQSEAHQGRADFLGNGTSLDSILRVWSADPAHPSCGVLPCELTSALSPVQVVEPALQIAAQGKLPGPIVVDGPTSNPGLNTFFGVPELNQTGLGTTLRGSLRPGGLEAAGASREPAVSKDGLRVAFTSEDDGLVPAAQVTWESGAWAANVDNLTGVASGTFAFFTGDDDVAGLDYSPEGPGTFSVQFVPTLDPLVFDVFGAWLSGSGPKFQADFLFGSTQAVASEEIVTDTTTVITTGAPTITTQTPLAHPSTFGISGIQSVASGDIEDGSIQLDALGYLEAYDISGTFVYTGDQAVTGEQIYVVDAPAGVASGHQLASRNADGAPGNQPSGFAALDFDGSHVAFDSEATNLVAADQNAEVDVFLVQLSPFSIQRASQRAGTGGNGASFDADLDDTGTLVAYNSFAANLTAAADTNGVADIFVYNSATGENERISVGPGGGPANGRSEGAAISGNGRYVAFDSDATNLLLTADSLGFTDIFVRDRQDDVTVRASVALGGGEPNGDSLLPDLDQSGRIVAFESDATNLVSDNVNLMGVPQCYVRDLDTGHTQLVSASLGGDGSNAACFSPKLSSDGRSVVFVSAATNLHPELAASSLARAYVFDRLTSEIQLFSLNQSQDVISADGANAVQTLGAFETTDTVSPLIFDDFNGVSDVFFAVAIEGPSLNTSGAFADADGTGVILHAFDKDTGLVHNSHMPVGQVAIGGSSFFTAVDGGEAYIIPAGPGAQPLYWWNPQVSAPVSLGILATAISASEVGLCAIDGNGDLQVAAGNFLGGATGGQAVEVKAHGSRCVYRTPSNELSIYEALTFTTDNTGQTVRDFQVGDEGVAFRTCEEDLVPPTDLNFDGDEVDCVMSFWAFQPEVPMAYLRQTNRVAVPCTFPGCDPFFEPYRVTAGLVSFVTDERQETDEDGSGGTGVSCLPTSPEGVCDVTGDDDGDDIAVEIFSVASGQSQVFPVDEENPPEVPPFPQVSENPNGDGGAVLTIQLPASLLGEEFASLAPDTKVTVVVGDPEGDGTFEADGNLDPETAVVDLCQEVADPNQVDEDGDLTGTDCDVVETVDENDQVVEDAQGDPITEPNDDPVAPVAGAAAEIPGSNLCDLNGSGTITRAEVDQIWADRGLPAGSPVELDVQAGDDRDADADGEITAADFRLCLTLCAGQAGGCPETESSGGNGGGYKSCGLLGIEALLALIPLALRRRRMRS